MGRKETSPSADIQRVKEKHEARIMTVPGVTGIGIGEDDAKPGPAIKVYVERLTPDLRKELPKTLDGYPVVLEETGEFRAF